MGARTRLSGRELRENHTKSALAELAAKRVRHQLIESHLEPLHFVWPDALLLDSLEYGLARV
jgi:hypothetical protein